MQATLNGGPFDGKVCELTPAEWAAPILFTGYKHDGFARLYKRVADGRFQYDKTITCAELKRDYFPKRPAPGKSIVRRENR